MFKTPETSPKKTRPTLSLRTRSDSVRLGKAHQLPRVSEDIFERTSVRQMLDEWLAGSASSSSEEALSPPKADADACMCKDAHFVGLLHHMQARLVALEADVAVLKKELCKEPRSPGHATS